MSQSNFNTDSPNEMNSIINFTIKEKEPCVSLDSNDELVVTNDRFNIEQLKFLSQLLIKNYDEFEDENNNSNLINNINVNEDYIIKVNQRDTINNNIQSPFLKLKNEYINLLNNKFKEYSKVIPFKHIDNNQLFINIIDSFIDNNNKNKRSCIRFSKEIKTILMNQFEVNAHPSEKQKATLSTITGLKLKQIEIWFANQRMRNNKYRKLQQLTILSEYNSKE